MIRSVSPVHFGNAAAAPKYSTVQELIESPGSFTKTPEVATVQEPKKGGFMKKLGKVVLTAVGIAAAMVAANKLGFKPSQLDDTAGFFKKGLNHVAQWCETVSKYTWDKLAALVSRSA